MLAARHDDDDTRITCVSSVIIIPTIIINIDINIFSMNEDHSTQILHALS